MANERKKRVLREKEIVDTRPTVSGDGERFAIYVNPNALDDPEGLQRLAYPYLSHWFRRTTRHNNILKRNILKAVLLYVEQHPEAADRHLQRSLVLAESQHIAQIVIEEVWSRLQAYLSTLTLMTPNPNGLQTSSFADVDEDTDSFYSQFIEYEAE